ncbi:MAG: hypothetical protein ABSH07_12920 [Candidatus Dormibacteria bacterium]
MIYSKGPPRSTFPPKRTLVVIVIANLVLIPAVAISRSQPQ